MSNKTPGVKVKEISIFPPSVAQVETAIPAFIGYTAKAEKNGRNLTNVPTRVTSMLEFENCFGGAPSPNALTVDLDTGNNPLTVTLDRPYYLYYSMRVFFDNGGGDCYVVSVGEYKQPTGDPEDLIDSIEFNLGLDAVALEDEPTLIVIPDAVHLSVNNLGNLQNNVLNQCNILQDRFGIFDIRNAGENANVRNESDAFRNNIGMNYLKYGAAYYPFIRSNIPIEFSYSDLTITKSGGGIGLDAISENTALITDLENAINSQTALTDLLGDTFGDGTQTFTDFFEANITANKAQIVHWTNVIRDLIDEILDRGTGGGSPVVNTDIRTQIDNLAGNTVGDWPTSALGRIIRSLVEYDLGYFYGGFLALSGVNNGSAVGTHTFEVVGDLSADVAAGSRIDITDFAINDGTYTVNTVAFAGGNTTLTVDEPIPDNTVGGNLHHWSENETPIGEIDLYADYADYALTHPTNASTIYGAGATEAERANAARGVFRGLFEQTLQLVRNLIAGAGVTVENLESQLSSTNPVYAKIVDAINRENLVLPPSGFIAGIYAAVDENRGVWKAPANVSLNSVAGPLVKIDDAMQEDMNVDVNAGKSINAIRFFTGKGTLVWGARTLAGNDNEWRYVSVRRFFNMVEESIKKSTAWAVFEPNDANTWTRVRAMISNFLNILWRDGALQGATPDDAFFVKVGLGTTMTYDDILNGVMNVEIGMAAVRPAEFIILKFSHKIVENA